MYTKTVFVLEAGWTSREETKEHMETKPGQRNPGQQNELETGGSCCTRHVLYLMSDVFYDSVALGAVSPD